MTYSVVIPTYNRADCIMRNLVTLAQQRPPPVDVVVVDASTDERTQLAIEQFRRESQSEAFNLVYLKNVAGRGNTPHSRNLGVRSSRGDVLAFLDDDAFPHDGWAEAMLETYQRMPDVVGIAGRTLNGQPGEATVGVSEVGKLRSDGTVAGFFAADTGDIVDVDHMLGANCSWRRSAFEELGGQDDTIDLGPQCLMEETEICLKARRDGMRLVFNPRVIADHIGAPQPGGKRFSRIYSYRHSRNNLAMLVRVYGASWMVVRHVFSAALSSILKCLRTSVGAWARLVCELCGLAAGLARGILPKRHAPSRASVSLRTSEPK